MRNRTLPSALVALSFLAALATGAALAAGDGAAAASPPPAGEDTSGANLDGLTVSWEPRSREVREPTEEQLATLRAELEAMLAVELGPKDGTSGEHPSGGRYFVVPSRFMEAIFVRVGPDGTSDTGCVDLERVPEVLARPAATAKAPVR